MPLTFTRKTPEKTAADNGCTVLDIRFDIITDDPFKDVYGAYGIALENAAQKGCESVAVPVTAYKDLSYKDIFRLAVAACRRHLQDHETYITLCVTDDAATENRFCNIIEEAEKERPVFMASEARCKPAAARAPKSVLRRNKKEDAAMFCEAADVSLEDHIKNVDKGFSETLLELIDKSGMTDVQCYKRANVDRKLFSKIRSTPDYRPKKTTALSFCIALSLTLEQTKSLLEKAGYALSRSNRGDLIVEYFITRGKYDIYEINEALFEYDQALLGV